MISEMIDSFNEALLALFRKMEEYLLNILNAPSTINRIIKYYSVGYNPDEPNKHFILFNYTIVNEYKLIVDNEDMRYF